MFALRVRYLMGRVYAADFDDGDAKQAVEWPPHPSRLFSALAASWGEGGAEPELRPALEWLEQQPPPELYFGDCFQRSPVTCYVPVNDSRGAEALPEERPRKERKFPSASLLDPEAWFVWPDTLPNELAPAMDTLLRRTPSMGHSASVVAVEVANAVPERLKRLVPDRGARQLLRVASPGRLSALEESFDRFQATGSKVHRPRRGATAPYGFAEGAKQAPARGIFGEILVLKRVSGDRTPIDAAIAVTTALRGALMQSVDQPPPEVISGHAPASTPDAPVRTDKPHVALIPLPFVGSRYATGEILGAGIVLPRAVSREDRDIVLRAAANVQRIGRWHVEAAGIDEPRSNLRAGAWTKAETVWATVTPYVFDRFPGDPFGDEAQEVVRTSFERVGLPRPVSVALMTTSVHLGVPPSGRFEPAPGRAGKPKRFHLHALVTFDRPVEGPVIVGAGRFYGYGLFRGVQEVS